MRKHLTIALTVVLGIIGATSLASGDAGSWDGSIVQYGTMHEAVGQQQHQGRVALDELAKPGFYGVAALEGLTGEVTIHDGQVTVTGVEAGSPHPIHLTSGQAKATLLVGAWVPSWKEVELDRKVGTAEFDRTIADAATAAGIDLSKPFVFTVQGEFVDLDYHVINGACPMHARLKKIELPEDQRAFEARLASVRGVLVGVFAEDAVGKLTHPDASTHTHVVFSDEATGETVTGHVESVALGPGSVVRLPN